MPYVKTGKPGVPLRPSPARMVPWAAQFGKNITTEEGVGWRAAVAIDPLGTLHAATGGDLEPRQAHRQVMSLVNSTGDFTEQHLVTNGASELLGQVLATRACTPQRFGVAQIPMGVLRGD